MGLSLRVRDSRPPDTEDFAMQRQAAVTETAVRVTRTKIISHAPSSLSSAGVARQEASQETSNIFSGNTRRRREYLRV